MIRRFAKQLAIMSLEHVWRIEADEVLILFKNSTDPTWMFRLEWLWLAVRSLNSIGMAEANPKTKRLRTLAECMVEELITGNWSRYNINWSKPAWGEHSLLLYSNTCPTYLWWKPGVACHVGQHGLYHNNSIRQESEKPCHRSCILVVGVSM